MTRQHSLRASRVPRRAKLVHPYFAPIRPTTDAGSEPDAGPTLEIMTRVHGGGTVSILLHLRSVRLSLSSTAFRSKNSAVETTTKRCAGPCQRTLILVCSRPRGGLAADGPLDFEPRGDLKAEGNWTSPRTRVSEPRGLPFSFPEPGERDDPTALSFPRLITSLLVLEDSFMTAHRKPSAAAAPPLDDDLFSYYFSFFNDGTAPSAMDPNPGKRPRADDPSSSRHVVSKPSESSSPSPSSADEEDEELQRPELLPPQPQQQQRRVWVRDRSSDWWDRYNHPELPEVEFRRAFRMSRATFDFLCEELGSAVAKEDTALRAAIPVRQRVAVCVWRLATGEPLRLVSRRFGLGISTCHKLVLEVCAAIRNVLMPRSLAWPDSAGAAAAAARFEALSGIPNVVGAMYTTHFPVIAPRVSVAAYFNRRHTERNQKSSYTVTLQGVVDPDGIFTDVCIGWPGSMPDDQVLEKSALYQRANSGLLNNQWIVGGAGHALLDWVLVPYAQANLTWAQHAFNEKVGAVQRVAKEAFARLKGRWGCLQKRTEVKLKDLPVVLGACCVLHNLCEMRKEEMEPELRFELLDDEMVAENGLRSLRAMHFRDSIAHNLFHHGLAGTSYL
ncbi:hypothetical protein BHE74_00028772 [Ensete ventricosum]|nr:hypothetical protein BHE74_00028772 [Ensete ventricosum]RZS03484.1 hypothetical protein BHM03_00033683 [Ensete ventricosum]